MDVAVETRPVGRPPKQIDQRQRILLQAAEVIASVGYEQCSLATIATQLELTRPALYHYFSTKQQIFVEIALASMEGIHAHVTRRLDAKQSPKLQLRSFMLAHAEYFDAHYWLVNATIVGYAGIARRELEPGGRFDSCRKKYERCLYRVLRAGVRDGTFDAIDIKATALSVFQLLNISRWYRPGQGRSAVDIAEANFELIINGIRPR